MNFHDNLKIENRRIDFSFVSAHCASSIKTGSILRGEGVCISLVVKKPWWGVKGWGGKECRRKKCGVGKKEMGSEGVWREGVGKKGVEMEGWGGEKKGGTGKG